MHPPIRLAAALAVVAFLVPGAAAGQGGSEAAIVKSEKAPVYSIVSPEQVSHSLSRGDAVAGMTEDFPHPSRWVFQSSGTRVRVAYFRSDYPDKIISGWMEAKDLAPFVFDGSCEAAGSPFAMRDKKLVWNTCFEKARDARLAALRREWEKPAAAAP